MPWLLGREWASGQESFPRLLRWALVAAPLCLVAAWMVPYTNSDAVKAVMIFLYAVGGLCGLLAVPTAIFLVSFRPQYRNRANLLITLVAAIPFIVATLTVFLLWALMATGGSIH